MNLTPEGAYFRAVLITAIHVLLFKNLLFNEQSFKKKDVGSFLHE